jgi:hypothetical protein
MRRATRRTFTIGAAAWAAVGAAVAGSSLGRVDADALWFVGLAAVLFPLAAAGAAVALSRRRDRTAGLLLVVSVLTPTYFAWVLNVGPLVVGVALLLRPRAARSVGREPNL